MMLVKPRKKYTKKLDTFLPGIKWRKKFRSELEFENHVRGIFQSYIDIKEKKNMLLWPKVEIRTSKGWTDIFVTVSGKTFAIEAKTDKGSLTPAQKEFRERATNAGMFWRLIRPSDYYTQVLEVLRYSKT